MYMEGYQESLIKSLKGQHDYWMIIGDYLLRSYCFFGKEQPGKINKEEDVKVT
jgi:hypothetical protein